MIAGATILLGTALVCVRGVIYASETFNVNGQTAGGASLGYGAFLIPTFGGAAAVSSAWRPL